MIDQALQPSPVFVGDLLKEAREGRGLSLEAVAKVLCIRKAQLESLEEDEGTLVCNVYTIGFLKSYAQFLGLNATVLIQKLKEQAASSSSTQRLSFPAPRLEKGMPSLRVVFLSLLGLIGLCVGYGALERYAAVPLRPAEEIFPAPVVVVPPSPSVVETPPVPESVTINHPPQEESLPLASSPVQLKATEDTWVEVKDGQGNVLLRRLLYKGETHTFSSPLGVTLRTGNAAGVRLVSGEKTLEFPGEHGVIKGGISLETSQWGGAGE